MATKVVCFDFDDTLYSGIDWTKEWADYCKIGMRKIFSELSDEEFNKLVKKEDVGTFTSNNIVRIMQKYGKDVHLWLDYRKMIDCELDYSKCKCISNNELKKFAKKYVLYIVSNSIRKEIDKTAIYFNMDLTLFKKVVTNDYKHALDKKYLYEQIIKEEKILPRELFVIGDNKKTDIDPALEIGAKGALVTNCSYKIEDFGL